MEGLDGRKAAAVGGGALALLLIVGLAAWALWPAPKFWVRIPEGRTYGPMTIEEFNDLFDARWDEVVVCRVGSTKWTTVQEEPYLAREEAPAPRVAGAERYDFGIPAYAQRDAASAPAAPAPRMRDQISAATTPGERRNLIEQAGDAPQMQRRRAAVFGAGAAQAGAAAAGSVGQASKR